jgi:rubrerythrin
MVLADAANVSVKAEKAGFRCEAKESERRNSREIDHLGTASECRATLEERGFMMPAKHFDYYENWKTEILTCPKCAWSGTFEQGSLEYYHDLMDSSCPVCGASDAPILAIVSYPTIEEADAHHGILSDSEKN